MNNVHTNILFTQCLNRIIQRQHLFNGCQKFSKSIQYMCVVVQVSVKIKQIYSGLNLLVFYSILFIYSKNKSEMVFYVIVHFKQNDNTCFSI